MEKNIINFLNKNKFCYVSIPKESLKNIHELLINDKEFEPVTDIENLYTGVYWSIKNDVDKKIKYYLDAFNLKNVSAMINLGRHYKKISKFNDAIEYYLVAIENGYMENICDIAYCYEKISNFDDAIRYYLLAIKHDDTSAMYNLAYYYQNISKFDEAIKYYLMAIGKCSPTTNKFLFG